jgi:hypothetical protein
MPANANKKGDANSVRVLLRLPHSLYARIQKQAKAEETTATSHMIRLLATAGAQIASEAEVGAA